MTTPATSPAAERSATPARTSDRFGTWALWIAAGALLASPTILAFDSGGSGPEPQALAATVAFALLGALALLAPWPLVERSWPLAALTALVAFAAWTAASVSWSSALGDAANDAVQLGLYAVAFAVAVIVMRAPGPRGLAPDALLWGIALVATYALGGRLLPELVEVETSTFAGDRLAEPISYWNGLGILTSCGALLATAVAGHERRPLAYRSVACALAVPCALACYLTLSRASWAALATGLVACLLLRPRAASLVAAGLWLCAAGVLVVALRAFPGALHLDRGEAAQIADGRPVALAALAATVVVALAFAGVVRRSSGGRGGPVARLPERMRPLLAAAAVPLVLACAFAVSAATERTEEISKSTERVTTLKTFRGEYWDVALGTFAAHPLAGTGAASFQVEWTRERETRQFAADAHSLYIETLAELGLVGALLLAAFAGCVSLGIRRAWRAAPDDPLLAASSAVLAAFAVHAGVDWDWEIPAVTLPALLLAAAIVQRPLR